MKIKISLIVATTTMINLYALDATAPTAPIAPTVKLISAKAKADVQNDFAKAVDEKLTRILKDKEVSSNSNNMNNSDDKNIMHRSNISDKDAKKLPVMIGSYKIEKKGVELLRKAYVANQDGAYYSISKNNSNVERIEDDKIVFSDGIYALESGIVDIQIASKSQIQNVKGITTGAINIKDVVPSISIAEKLKNKEIPTLEEVVKSYRDKK